MNEFYAMETKQETPKIGVGVFIIKTTVTKKPGGRPENRKVEVLLGLRKNTHGAGEWALPGGHLDIGESFLKCCRREVFEETGITIGGILPLDFTNDIFEDEGLHYVTLYFRAFFDSGKFQLREPELREPDKCERWEWFDRDHLPENIWPPIREFLKAGRQNWMNIAWICHNCGHMQWQEEINKAISPKSISPHFAAPGVAVIDCRIECRLPSRPEQIGWMVPTEAPDGCLVVWDERFMPVRLPSRLPVFHITSIRPMPPPIPAERRFDLIERSCMPLAARGCLTVWQEEPA